MIICVSRHQDVNLLGTAIPCVRFQVGCKAKRGTQPATYWDCLRLARTGPCRVSGGLAWFEAAYARGPCLDCPPLLGRKFGQCMGILDSFGLVQIQLGPAENVAKRSYFQVFVTMGFLRRKKTLALRCSCRTNITVNHFDIWSPHLNLNESLEVQCAPESHSVLPSIALAADTSSPDMMIQYCLCSTSWLCWP